MDKPARRHRLDGLEPDNLLAFLALLGLLRALDVVRPAWQPRAAWDLDRPPLRPVLHLAGEQSREAITRAAAEGLTTLAVDYEFPAERADAAPQNDLNYSPVRARQMLVEMAEGDRRRADLWASLISDGAVRDDKIEPTPLCLLFGQGHQHFLSRLSLVPRLEASPPRGRGRGQVVLSAAETILEALFQSWPRLDPTPSFRWDPAEAVRYALRADDPSGEKATTQHGANRLAVFSLPILTVAPVRRAGRIRLETIGGTSGREFAFAWPIWRQPATLAAIGALLSHPDLHQGPASLAHLGVEQVRCTRRISLGKFMNFTRAEAV